MKQEVVLKNGLKVVLRHLIKSDTNGVWKNFNDIVDEAVFLPVLTPVISEIEKKAWYKNVKKEREIVIVAENPNLKPPDNIIGQCEISNSEWEAASHIGSLGIIINIDYRNLGLGRHLIDLAVKESKKLNNKEKIILSCFSTNEGIHLYESMGFKIIGKREKQFYLNGRYYDEILFDLWIEDYLKEHLKT